MQYLLRYALWVLLYLISTTIAMATYIASLSLRQTDLTLHQRIHITRLVLISTVDLYYKSIHMLSVHIIYSPQKLETHHDYCPTSHTPKPRAGTSPKGG